MSNKQKKKRNKKYTGLDASVNKKRVVRVNAPERSAFGEWWVDHKQSIILRSAFISLVTILGLIIWFILSIIF